MSRLFIGAIASVLLTGTALSADLIIEEAAPAVATSSSTWGVVELGVQGVAYDETNSDTDGVVGGVYGSFALWGDLGGLIVGVDGYGEYLDLDSDDADSVAAGVGIIGVHIGAEFDEAYLGGFGAVGWAADQGNDEYEPGYVVGIETLAKLDGYSVFGQLGYGDIRVDDGDKGFTGAFVEGGFVFELADDLAVLASAGYGYVWDEYTGSGEDIGSYATVGAKLAYKLPTDFNLVLTASYDFTYFADHSDDNEATEHTVKIGLAIPFGDDVTAAAALNPLATPTTPFRSASYGDIID